MPLMNYFVGEKNCRFEILVWHKRNPIPTCNNKYLSDTEYCLLFRDSGTTKIYGDFNTKSKYYISSTNKSDKDNYFHPTIKPIEFVKNHIYNALDPNQDNSNFIVLDTFIGSGTTAIACQELGCSFLGFEINQEYYNIACDRLKGVTVKERELKEQGIQTIFDFLERE